MYIRAVKGTFTNEVMKNSVVNFMIDNFDLKHGMIMAFKMHLSENQVLHVAVFPDEETSEQFVKLKDQLLVSVLVLALRSFILCPDRKACHSTSCPRIW